MNRRVLTVEEAEQRILELELQAKQKRENMTDAEWAEEMADVQAYDEAIADINNNPDALLYGNEFLDALRDALKI